MRTGRGVLPQPVPTTKHGFIKMRIRTGPIVARRLPFIVSIHCARAGPQTSAVNAVKQHFAKKARGRVRPARDLAVYLEVRTRNSLV